MVWVVAGRHSHLRDWLLKCFQIQQNQNGSKIFERYVSFIVSTSIVYLMYMYTYLIYTVHVHVHVHVHLLDVQWHFTWYTCTCTLYLIYMYMYMYWYTCTCTCTLTWCTMTLHLIYMYMYSTLPSVTFEFWWNKYLSPFFTTTHLLVPIDVW